MTTKIKKTYSEAIKLKTFKDRFEFLKLSGIIGDRTFGGYRYLNQVLYKDTEWKRVRRNIILRDNGFDLAHKDVPISGFIYVHHINPITIEDVLNRSFMVFDENNLISCSLYTHQALHYQGTPIDEIGYAIRKPGDTKIW